MTNIVLARAKQLFDLLDANKVNRVEFVVRFSEPTVELITEATKVTALYNRSSPVVRLLRSIKFS